MENEDIILDKFCIGEIIDQSLFLNIDKKNLNVKGKTKLRIYFNSIAENFIIKINSKLLNIDNYKINEISILNKDKKEKKIDFSKTTNVEFYNVSPEKQFEFFNNSFNKECKPNLQCYKILFKNIENVENNGFWEFKVSFLEDLNQYKYLKKNSYKFYCTLELDFSIVNPNYGGYFFTNLNGIYFLKNNKYHSSCCLFPTINDKIYMSNINIFVNGFEDVAIASGNIVEKIKNKDGVLFKFKLNSFINPDDLCILVGKFYHIKLSNYECYSDYNIDENIVKKFNKNLMEIEKIEIQLFGRKLKSNKLIIMNGIIDFEYSSLEYNKLINSSNYFGYRNLFIIDYNFFPNYLCPDSFEVKVGYFLKSKFLSIMNSFIYYNKSDNGYWLINGLLTFLQDIIGLITKGSSYFSYLIENKKEWYYNFCKNGYEKSSLINSNILSNLDFILNPALILKANIFYHLLTNYLQIKLDNISWFFNIFLKNFEDFSYDILMSNIQVSFGVKKLRKKLNTFLNTSGMMELSIFYYLNLKENKLRFEYQQKIINQEYFIKSYFMRSKIENNFNLFTPHIKLLEDTKFKLTSLEKQDGVLDYEKFQNYYDSKSVVNLNFNCLKMIETNIDFFVIESSKIETKEDILELNINKYEEEVYINLKQRLKRPLNHIKVEFEENNINNNFSNVNKSETNNNKSKISVHSNNNNNNNFFDDSEFTWLWVEMDPHGNNLIKYKLNETKETLLTQLEKTIKGEFLQTIRLIKQMKFLSIDDIGITFTNYIWRKDIQIIVKIEILKILDELMKEEYLEKIYDILLNYIYELKVLEEGIIKSNDFNYSKEYLLIIKILDSLIKYENKVNKDTNESQTDDNLCKLLYLLIKKNDNSINKYDDHNYISNILGFIMKTTNSRYFKKYLKEILRFLKIEFYTSYLDKSIIFVILENLSKFIYINLKTMSINSNKIKKFSDFELFHTDESFAELHLIFENLINKYKGHPSLSIAVFKHKTNIKIKYKKYGLMEYIIYSFKYFEKLRNKYGILVYHSLLKYFSEWLFRNKEKLNELQLDMDFNKNYKLFQLLWNLLNCGYTYSDLVSRTLFFRVYESFYDEFIPIVKLKELKLTLFPVDNYWYNLKEHLNFDTIFKNKKKFISFKFLSLQKTKKNGQVVSLPQNYKYCFKDLIIFNFKLNREQLNKKNMAKQIFNIILNEKITKQIEKKVSELVKSNTKEGNSLKHHLHYGMMTIKDIKKKIIKPEVISLKEIKENLMSTVKMYKNYKLLNSEIYQEYLKFINILFSEGEKILIHKKMKESYKIKKFK